MRIFPRETIATGTELYPTPRISNILKGVNPMAKGAYTFIAYPESSDIEEIKGALEASNWDYEISPLHDKDKNEDGTEKKPHYHIIVGFRRKVPEYKEFKARIKEVGGVVPPYNQCIVHDVEELDKYMSHDENCKSADGKAIYNEEDIYRSETWDVSAYITYTDRREKKSEKAKKSLQEIIVYCSKTKCSFSELIDNFINDGDTLGVIMTNAYAITQYIKSVK